MKLTTAGESHGKALCGIIEGMPKGLEIDENYINNELSLRQKGYGRSQRQSIEKDTVEILTGLMQGKTIGSPITLLVKNADYRSEQETPITKVRPGHADFSGCMKYETQNVREILERASARETAIRVASGAVFKQYLSSLGVEITGRVHSVGKVTDESEFDKEKAVLSPIGMCNARSEKKAIDLIDKATKRGDTLGGTVEIYVENLKCGFGSFQTYEEKLDGKLCGELMSVQGAKGVEIGDGFACTEEFGSDVHDELFYKDETYFRKTNHAGGIEGGMSNGETIVIRVAMKPIPTLKKGLSTVDIETKEKATAESVRSDVCAIYAFEKICESVVAKVIACCVSDRLGGDTMEQVKKRYDELKSL